jgi:hypothetical protein
MPRRALITQAGTRNSLHGATLVRGDELRFSLRIVDTELTGCSLRFTAKSQEDDLDDLAEIAKSSESGGGITITTNTGNVLNALIVVPSVDTSPLEIPSNNYKLFYDVQLVRANPTNSAKVQTFFRHEKSFFYLMGDITQANG